MKKEYRVLIKLVQNLNQHFTDEVSYTIIDFIDVKGFALQKNYKITQCDECNNLTYDPMVTIPLDIQTDFHFGYLTDNLNTQNLLLARGDHIWVVRFMVKYSSLQNIEEFQVYKFHRLYKNKLEIERFIPVNRFQYPEFNRFLVYKELTEEECEWLFENIHRYCQIAIKKNNGEKIETKYVFQCFSKINKIKELVKLIEPFVS